MFASGGRYAARRRRTAGCKAVPIIFVERRSPPSVYAFSMGRSRWFQDLEAYLGEHDPWGLGTHYFRTKSKLRRSWRRLRYRRMPSEGWGDGWRVLVFRYRNVGEKRSQELHVLAPVKGDSFDWDTLRLHVRGEPWPDIRHELGRVTGVMVWHGHHIGVTTDEFGAQRIPMDRLIPGEFRGGVDVGLVLIDVRRPASRD